MLLCALVMAKWSTHVSCPLYTDDPGSKPADIKLLSYLLNEKSITKKKISGWQN